MNCTTGGRYILQRSYNPSQYTHKDYKKLGKVWGYNLIEMKYRDKRVQRLIQDRCPSIIYEVMYKVPFNGLALYINTNGDHREHIDHIIEWRLRIQK